MKLQKERILVTGGYGFLGQELVRQLRKQGCCEVFAFTKAEYDLTNLNDVKNIFDRCNPSVVFHLAAKSGGIAVNAANPGSFFYENSLMNIYTLEEARIHNVKKLVCLGSVCTYPKVAPMPLRETDLWNGYPEETNASYAITKRSLLRQLQAYRAQYELDGIFLFFGNIYGPEDDFDLYSSHVIPAMIRKFLTATREGSRAVEFWGDGSPTREFLYRDDAIKALIEATVLYAEQEPLNVATGNSVSIKELAEILASIIGYKGQIKWDPTKPNGQQCRSLDVSRAKKIIGFDPKVSLREGLQSTIEWYQKSHQSVTGITARPTANRYA